MPDSDELIDELDEDFVVDMKKKSLKSWIDHNLCCVGGREKEKNSWKRKKK